MIKSQNIFLVVLIVIILCNANLVFSSEDRRRLLLFQTVASIASTVSSQEESTDSPPTEPQAIRCWQQDVAGFGYYYLNCDYPKYQSTIGYMRGDGECFAQYLFFYEDSTYAKMVIRKEIKYKIKNEYLQVDAITYKEVRPEGQITYYVEEKWDDEIALIRSYSYGLNYEYNCTEYTECNKFADTYVQALGDGCESVTYSSGCPITENMIGGSLNSKPPSRPWKDDYPTGW